MAPLESAGTKTPSRSSEGRVDPVTSESFFAKAPGLLAEAGDNVPDLTLGGRKHSSDSMNGGSSASALVENWWRYLRHDELQQPYGSRGGGGRPGEEGKGGERAEKEKRMRKKEDTPLLPLPLSLPPPMPRLPTPRFGGAGRR